jgi:hypothetical protein
MGKYTFLADGQSVIFPVPNVKRRRGQEMGAPESQIPPLPIVTFGWTPVTAREKAKSVFQILDETVVHGVFQTGVIRGDYHVC